MKDLFKNIKAVGFDLDNTLYPPNQSIDEAITKEVVKTILERLPRLGDALQTRRDFEKKYDRLGSRTKALEEMGFQDSEIVMRKCLENAEIINLINPDPETVRIIDALKQRFFLFLITSSPSRLSVLKLQRIGLEPRLFDYTLFGDDESYAPKISGMPFRHFLNQSMYKPAQHVYIGDSKKADILPAKSMGIKTISVGKDIAEADFSVKDFYGIESLLL